MLRLKLRCSLTALIIAPELVAGLIVPRKYRSHVMNSTREEINRDRRRLFTTVAVTVAAAQLGTTAFAGELPRGVKEETSATIVLVHGAWADGSSWDRVMTLLQSKGLRTMAAPIPLTSLSDDIAALERALERTEGPVVLVAHAYSGAVVGSCNNERVKSLVFITALTPDEGETVAKVFYRDKLDPNAPKLAPDRHGFLWLSNDAFGTAWCQNASREEAALLAAAQRPIALACIQETASKPAWRGKPSWYLVAEEDRMINPATQLYLARRMGAQIQSEKVDHAVLITAPEVAAGVIFQAVAGVTVDPNKDGPSKRQHG
jgi:pimeloyl-ACP methyl ester carboxylesterase